MAISRQEKQITWSAANSLSIAAGGTGTSDAFAFDADAFQASISFKADNNGTPASGDTVDFYLLWTSGDPDGAGADEYDGTNSAHAYLLGRIDTNAQDPAQRTVDIPASPKGGKVHAKNNSGGRAITVSATIYETNAGA